MRPLAGLRALHVTNSLEFGGAEQILLALLPGLRDAGADQLLLSLKGPRELTGAFRDRGIRVEHLGLEGLASISRAASLPEVIRRGGHNLVHTHLFISDCVGGWAARWAGQTRLVSTRYDDGSWMGPAHRALERASFSLFRSIVAVSHGTRDVLVSRGAPANRLAVLPHSTLSSADVDRRRRADCAAGAEERPGPQPTGLGGGADGPILCTVGRLVPVKRTADVLRAAAALRVRFPRLRVWSIGTGPEEEALRAEAARLGISAAVTFWGRQEDTLPFLERANVFVLASSSEGLPMAIVEAMALGKPIVATAVGGVPELLGRFGDGACGLLTPPGDVSALSGAISQLLDDRALAAQLGARARLGFLKSYTSAAMVDAYIALYKKLGPWENRRPESEGKA